MTQVEPLLRLADIFASIDRESGDAKMLRAAAKEIEDLRDGIRDYLNGNYPNPHDTRPEPCKHGQLWYTGCEACSDEHFRSVLMATK